MSQEARYFRVGAFVLIGVGLIVAGLILLGGRSLLEEPQYFETYFPESVQGLEVGSPVKLMGVQIGEVTEIGFVEDYYTFASNEQRLEYTNWVMVTMAVARPGDPYFDDPEFQARNRARLIERGLRLQLTTQGITGVAFIQANFVDPEANPPPEIPWEPETIYIPSTPSTLARISTAAERIFGRLEDMEIEKVIEDLDTLLVSLNEAVVNADVPAFRQEAQALLGELRTDLERADIPGVGQSARDALDEANATLARVRQAADGGRYDLEQALENLRVATENLRDLTDTLRAQPSLLIRSGAPKDGQ